MTQTDLGLSPGGPVSVRVLVGARSYDGFYRSAGM